MTYSKMGIALVTGASTGIGAIYADRLARRGYDLILVARSREKLDAAAKRIAGSTGRNVNTGSADLGNKADLKVSSRCSAPILASPFWSTMQNGRAPSRRF